LDGADRQSNLHGHPQKDKRSWQFTALVAMAKSNLIFHVCFQTILKTTWLNDQERNLEIVKLYIFKIEQGGVLQKKEKSI